MLDKATKSEIDDLYDGTPQCINELAGLFNISESKIRYYLDYKGYRGDQIKRNRNWQKENIVRFRELSNKAAKKYQLKPENKIKRSKEYFKKKAEGYYDTKELKDKRREYNSRESVKKRKRKEYLERKKTGYYQTKEFKSKTHEDYLKRKLNQGSKRK